MTHRKLRKAGLQQGDRVTIVTATHDYIHLVAVKTRGGYVDLEVDAPADCGVWVRRVRGGQVRDTEVE